MTEIKYDEIDKVFKENKDKVLKWIEDCLFIEWRQELFNDDMEYYEVFAMVYPFMSDDDLMERLNLDFNQKIDFDVEWKYERLAELVGQIDESFEKIILQDDDFYSLCKKYDTSTRAVFNKVTIGYGFGSDDFGLLFSNNY